MITCKDNGRLVDDHEVCDEHSLGASTDDASQSTKDQGSHQHQHLHDGDEEEEEEGISGIGADVAWKFLLAGGIAGAGENVVET
jgi:hypothetical protein